MRFPLQGCASASLLGLALAAACGDPPAPPTSAASEPAAWRDLPLPDSLRPATSRSPIAVLGNGLIAISVPELPDYLPLFLEFVSLLPPAEARATLAETAHILAVLASRLKRRASGYAAVFEALVHLTGDREAIAGLTGVVAGPDDSSDNVAALDAAWEEAPVTFGPGDAASSNCNTGCGKWANVDFIATPAKQES